jgi:hypothetical protein
MSLTDPALPARIISWLSDLKVKGEFESEHISDDDHHTISLISLRTGPKQAVQPWAFERTRRSITSRSPQPNNDGGSELYSLVLVR